MYIIVITSGQRKATGGKPREPHKEAGTCEIQVATVKSG